jgi:putative ABC transport system permease protein
MTWERHVRRRPFWYLRRRSEEVASEIDEELAGHLDMKVEELRSRGWSPEDARCEAIRQFGDLEGTRQYCRQQDHSKERRMQGGLLLDDLTQDLRICVRTLLRTPGLAMTVVMTVGLGIGATTAMFGVINATLIRPLPYEHADRLVRIYTDSPPNKWPLSVADYLTLESQQTRFDQVAGYVERPMSFSDGSVAERVSGRTVTWTYFALLGLRPALGRSFNEADGRPGAPRAVIVSHGFWSRQLAGRADVVGKPVRLDGADYTVVGVLPERVGPLESGREFFIAAQWTTPPRKGPFPITTLARLRDSNRAAAAQELRAINRRMFPIWKASYQDERATWSMMALKTHVVGDVGTILGVALGAVGLVWLIACANAMNLLVARLATRRQELAVRAALGASRGRVTRYLLAESCVLAIGAAIVGVSLAWAIVGLVRDLAGDFLPRVVELALDGPVLWFLAGVTTVSGLLFGVVPALFGSQGPIAESLRTLGRAATGSPGVRRVRWALAAGQFAVATPLLIVAGLLAVSLSQLGRVDLGFERHNVVTGQVALPPAQYQDPARVAAFWTELRRRLERLPGVIGVAFADGRPPNEVLMVNNFDLEAAPTPPGRSQPATPWVATTPDYFELLGLALLQGRLFDERDMLDASDRVVVVDQAWARRFFPNGNAVGARFHEGGCTTCPWLTVIGVVSTVKYAGLDSPDEGTVYWALTPSRNSRFVVFKTSADPAIVVPSVREAIRQVDPAVPLARVATVDDLVTRSLQLPRSVSLVVGIFAVVAVLLSIVGIYSVMAHYVQQHSKDISIRLALGGSRGEVLRLIVGQGMRVVVVGVVVGLLTALVLTRLIARLLFEIAPVDIFTFGAVAALMLGVALIACLTPARRAIGVQPAAVLRAE